MQHQKAEAGDNSYRVRGLSCKDLSGGKAGPGIGGPSFIDESGRPGKPDHAGRQLSREGIPGDGGPSCDC